MKWLLLTIFVTGLLVTAQSSDWCFKKGKCYRYENGVVVDSFVVADKLKETENFKDANKRIEIKEFLMNLKPCN